MSGVRARELTARGRGAIRAFELCGPGVHERLLRLAPGHRLAPGEFGCVALRDASGALLDESLVLFESATRIEIHLHGAPALVARVVAELGVELEDHDSGPISLEARAVDWLARAECEAAARILLDQVEGALRRDLQALLLRSGEARRSASWELARRGREVQWLVRPARIVLAGPANAGKSTLFNLLVGSERAVVDPSAGTTRDPVKERVSLGAYPVDLFDTAGECDVLSTQGPSVERESHALTAALRNSADLVLHLVAPGHSPPASAERGVLVLFSQADRLARSEPSLALSAHRDPEGARALVRDAVHAALGWSSDPWVPGAGVPFAEEWVEVLERADADLERAVEGWLAGSPVVAQDARIE